MSPANLISDNPVHVQTPWTPALVESVHPVHETLLVDGPSQTRAITRHHERHGVCLVTQPAHDARDYLVGLLCCVAMLG